MAPRPFRILFITASRLGDAVLSSGLIRALHDNVENARFTIVASPLTAPLFTEVPDLERVIVMEKRPLGLHWPGLWNDTRQHKWGLIVDLRGSPISSLLARKRRAVWRKTEAKTHKVVEAAHLLKQEHDPPWPHIYLGGSNQAEAALLTAGDRPILALAPSANWLGKVWPAERYAQVARALLGPGGELEGGRLMVVGGPGDRAVAAPLLSALPKDRRIDLVDRAPLLTVAAALASARLFIGNDSGLMHLAAAMGAPTLGLFGPSDETLYAPWGEHVAAIRGQRSFDQIKTQDPRLDQRVCHMTDLSASAVLRAARSLLAESEPAHA